MREIQINKGQYLSDVLKEIPSNIVLSKTIPGCGATTLELESHRNSIIIVPNVPVITGKCEKFPNSLMGVVEGVTSNDIIEYLQRDLEFKKIMTTPESFGKVRLAFAESGADLYEDYFCLLDECHSLVKDVDYRSDIVLPIDGFFKFKGKALVSATPIELSDPRFGQQGFEIMVIKPTYNYKQWIDVLHTNHIFLEIKDYYLKRHNEKVFIFINSVNLIYSLICQLGIEKESSVFCAPKSRVKLITDFNFKNTYKNWDSKNAKRYNFFTGRFFNAFDIELEFKPDVLIITDVFNAEYTMLDVDTDCVQIVGRFRNGVNSITHIYNTNKNIPVKTKEQSEIEVKAHQHTFNVLKTLYDNAGTIEERRAFGEALDSLPYNRFIYPNGKTNYFAIDNKINEDLVKSRYNDMDLIDSAYRQCHFFGVESADDFNMFTSNDRLKVLRGTTNIKSKRKEFMAILNTLRQPYSEFDYDTITEIRKIDPLFMEAYDLLGKKKIEELKYSEKKMKEAIIMCSRKGNKAVQMVKNSFRVGQKYSNDFIKKELTRIYNELNIHPDKLIKGSMIQDYFEAIPTKIKGERGYSIISELL